jgi:hypothetical protein
MFSEHSLNILWIFPEIRWNNGRLRVVLVPTVDRKQLKGNSLPGVSRLLPATRLSSSSSSRCAPAATNPVSMRTTTPPVWPCVGGIIT